MTPRRPGRPARVGEATRTVVHLSPEQVAKAAAIGRVMRGKALPSPGDIVAGIRVALDAHPPPAAQAREVAA